MTRIVVLAGGVPHAHDYAGIGRALAATIATEGYDVAVVDRPELAAEALDGAAALVVDALWWRMEGEVYSRWREEWAYSPSQDTRDALASFVAGGGGLLALHTASICFDDWPEWGAIVGGAWDWGRSSHPPASSVHPRVVAEHPVVAGVATVMAEHDDMRDEVYGGLALEDGIDVLATARRNPDDSDQPVVWAHRYGAGRVVYVGFGHDAESIEHPVTRRLVAQGLGWILEER